MEERITANLVPKVSPFIWFKHIYFKSNIHGYYNIVIFIKIIGSERKHYSLFGSSPKNSENKTTKGGYSSSMIKYRITRDFIENHRVRALFDPYMHKALPHVMFPRTFHFHVLVKWLWCKPKIHTRERNWSF